MQSVGEMVVASGFWITLNSFAREHSRTGFERKGYLFLSIPSAYQRNGRTLQFSGGIREILTERKTQKKRNAESEGTFFFKDGVECLTVMIMLTSFASLKMDLVFFLVIAGCFVAFWILSVRARRQTDVDRPAKQWWFFVAALIGSSVFLSCRVRWWLGFVSLLPLALFSMLLRPHAKDVLPRERQRDSK